MAACIVWVASASCFGTNIFTSTAESVFLGLYIRHMKNQGFDFLSYPAHELLSLAYS